jgi:hypothetical protein
VVTSIEEFSYDRLLVILQSNPDERLRERPSPGRPVLDLTTDASDSSRATSKSTSRLAPTKT